MVSRKHRIRLAIAGAVLLLGAIAAYVATRSSDEQGPAAAASTPSRALPGESTAASGRGARGQHDRGAREFVTQEGIDEDAVPMTVEGRVLDGATGAPQAGVEVEFTLPDRHGPRATVIATSADDGQYRVEISTGRWDVRAHGAGVWAPPSKLQVEQPSGTAAVHHDVLVQRAGLVRGRVVRDGGATVASATVSVETTDAAVLTAIDETLGRSVIAGADGAFELNVPPGEIKLHATAADATEGFAAASVAPGQEVTIDVVIPAPAVVAGVVRDFRGDPVAGATVHVYDRVLGGGADQHLTTSTDSSGAYLIETIHPGTITVEAARGEATSPPTKRTVQAGEDLTIDLVLGEPLAVRGRVLGSDGEPVAGAKVNAVLQGARHRVPSVTTDADGGFELMIGQAGTYVVTANGDPAKARLVVALDADAAPLEIVLQDPGGIRGTITVAGGAPAPNATITVARFHREGDERAAPKSRPRARTLGAADGTFSLPELLPGTYDLVISAPGHEDTRVDDVVVSGGDWVDVAITLAGAPS